MMSAPSSDSAAIRQTIRALLAAGFKLDSVWDGEESLPVKNETEAVKAIMELDQAHLYMNKDGVDAGWLFFVLGNSPDEVVNDYCMVFESVIEPLTNTWN